MRPPLTQFHESFRLQFPFVFRQPQSLQLLLLARPCPPLSLLTFLGFHFHGLLPLPFLFLTPAVFAFFRPLQFWVLTTQPLFLLFPLLPVSASQWLPQCSALAFAPSVFSVLSCLVSHAFLPGSGTQPRCMFPFTLPRFAPTAVPRVLAFCFRFLHFPVPFRFLSSASVSLPATGPSVSSFPLFPLPPHSGFPGAPLRFRFLAFPVPPRLVSHPFSPGFRTRLCCLFPFVLPCFAPAAVPQVIPFRISPPGPVPDFRFLSSASVLASHYSASVSSFPFSSCFCLTVASSGDPSALASLVFPVLPSLISHAFLPGSGTQLPVFSLSSFPASLPQLFHRCLPSAFAFGLSPSNPLAFVRFSSGSDYSVRCSSFPSLPGSALQLLSRCPPPLSLPRFSPSLQPDLSCLPSGSKYSAFCSFPFALP